MPRIFLITCFLLSFSVFSQEKEIVKDDNLIPTSIFSTNFLMHQTSKESLASLHLTGHKFMIVDYYEGFSAVHTNRLNLDLRNFGRSFSFEDLTDNYSKALLNKFNVTTNNDHYIWNIPLANRQLQKQKQKQNQQIKNNQ